MIQDLENYEFLLNTSHQKFMEFKTDDKKVAVKYYKIIRNICCTKIIKENKLNEKAIIVIEKSLKLVNKNKLNT